MIYIVLYQLIQSIYIQRGPTEYHFVNKYLPFTCSDVLHISIQQFQFGHK